MVRVSSGGTTPDPVDPDDELTCPETFRLPVRASPYYLIDPKHVLVRVEEAGFIARVTGADPRRFVADCEAMVRNPGDPSAQANVRAVLRTWRSRIDLRPVFAAFSDDLDDILDNDHADWADEIRDRLGLTHLDPGMRGGPISVLLFRYPASDIPRLKGAGRDSRPVVPPTVLDGSFSQAFCPAPDGCAEGFTVDLSAKAPEPCREVLHPAFAFEPKHLFRVGEIRCPVGTDQLETARGLHLLALRARCARPDYADTTDGDLL